MRSFNKCLLTGGSGLLGRNLIPLFPAGSLLRPTSQELDITNVTSVEKYFDKSPNIDLVIHAAAYTDVKKAQRDYSICNQVNVIGTHNVLNACIARNIKIVYISTDAVFDGNKGMYEIGDLINPVSRYAKSKAAAELLVRTYDNSLVIRTSFFDLNFPYSKAFVDQWSSKDYIDIMAPKIFQKATSNHNGIAHVASERRTLFEIAKERRQDVEPIELGNFECGFQLPKDLSLKE